MAVRWDFVPDRNTAKRELTKRTNDFGFDLDPNAPIETLSIAQRQQLEIIRLLALGVKTLILDEPTTGISAEQKAILFNALRELAHNEGMIVLLVSHKLEDVIDLCDEVVVLRNGQLVGDMDMPTTDENLTSEVIRQTKKQLVHLMFGQELSPPNPPDIEFGDTVLTLADVHLSNLRLDMPNISLNVREGEVIGLAGLDGSGQRLFMEACVGLTKPNSGKIKVRNDDMTGKSFQQFFNRNVIFGAAGRLEEGLIRGLTLTEHMALVMDNELQVNWSRARSTMNRQIDHFRIRGRESDNIEQLSGGNQQRVLMALLPEHPTVLVLENPTRGLDVESARWIWEQLLTRRESGTPIIFSSAELDELVAYSDRILVFYAGQIHEVPDVSQTSTDELGHLIGGAFAKSGQ